MQGDRTKFLLDTLAQQVRETRRAYMTGVPGVTYDDMVAAAVRLIEMRACFERVSGRTVTSKPTAAQVATLLRSL